MLPQENKKQKLCSLGIPSWNQQLKIYQPILHYPSRILEMYQSSSSHHCQNEDVKSMNNYSFVGLIQTDSYIIKLVTAWSVKLNPTIINREPFPCLDIFKTKRKTNRYTELIWHRNIGKSRYTRNQVYSLSAIKWYFLLTRTYTEPFWCYDFLMNKHYTNIETKTRQCYNTNTIFFRV